MNKVNKALIQLLAVTTGCASSTNIELNSQEWQQLYDEAVAHQIHYTIIEEAYKYGAKVNPTLLEKWKKQTMSHFIKHYESFYIVNNLFAEFEKSGISVMGLKGIYFKDLYPKPELRTMGDIDILIKRQSLNDAVRIIESFEYIQIEKDDPKHLTFYHERYILIELHV